MDISKRENSNNLHIISDDMKLMCNHSNANDTNENSNFCKKKITKFDESNSLKKRSYLQSNNCFQKFLQAELEDCHSLFLWKACLAEFLGTLLLCFYHIGILLCMPSSETPSLLHISVGHGLFVTAIVTVLSETSGCHMNPAVTIALATLRHVSICRAFLYIIFQCTGAITGALLLKEIVHPNMTSSLGIIAPGDNISDRQLFLTELVITGFLLMIVTATSDKGRLDTRGAAVPFVVGLTVCVNTLLANKTSGSCMNPARALGPAIVTGNYKHVWLYWLGPCCGALLGSHLYDQCFASARSLPSVTRCCSKYMGVNDKHSQNLDVDLESDI